MNSRPFFTKQFFPGWESTPSILHRGIELTHGRLSVMEAFEYFSESNADSMSILINRLPVVALTTAKLLPSQYAAISSMLPNQISPRSRSCFRYRRAGTKVRSISCESNSDG